MKYILFTLVLIVGIVMFFFTVLIGLSKKVRVQFFSTSQVRKVLSMALALKNQILYLSKKITL